MPRYALLLLVALSTIRAPSLDGAELSEIEALLNHTIVGDVQPLAEMQSYCDARVPRMPNFETADGWQVEAERLRQAVLERIVYRGEAARWRDACSACCGSEHSMASDAALRNRIDPVGSQLSSAICISAARRSVSRALR